jgi:hypothetical protein
MLWYLHLASDAGITVMEYQDSPVATGEVLKGARVALFLLPSGRKSPYYQVPISTPP